MPLLGGAGSPANTTSRGPRPTSVPSGILIHPAVWPQQTWSKSGGAVLIISTTLDVTKGIFAALYVSIMGLTRCYKNSSGDEIANVNFFTQCAPEATGIR